MPLLLTVARVLSVILPAIGAVKAILPSHSAPPAGASDPVQTIIQKIEALLAAITGTAWQDPNSIENDIADLEAALGLAVNSGLISGSALSLVQDAQAAIGKAAAALSNYKGGQMAVLDSNFSAEGIPGYIGAWSKGGAVAQLLGEA